MAFWSDKAWRAKAPSAQIVTPFREDRVEDANYLLSIGDEVFISSAEKNSAARRLAVGEAFTINPGQFAFILTEETVRIPFNAIALISIRASRKFNGLVNISGFHVDPGYRGKLIFAVSNAGPSPIHLKRGDPLFPIWLADLDQQIERTRIKNGYDTIPTQLTSSVGGNFTTAFEVNEGLKKQRDEVEKMRNDLIELKSFRLHVYVIFGILTLLLGPVLSDTIKSGYARAVKVSAETSARTTMEPTVIARP